MASSSLFWFQVFACQARHEALVVLFKARLPRSAKDHDDDDDDDDHDDDDDDHDDDEEEDNDDDGDGTAAAPVAGGGIVEPKWRT